MSKTGSDSINYSCVIDFPFYDFWIRFWNCMVFLLIILFVKRYPCIWILVMGYFQWCW